MSGFHEENDSENRKDKRRKTDNDTIRKNTQERKRTNTRNRNGTKMTGKGKRKGEKKEISRTKVNHVEGRAVASFVSVIAHNSPYADLLTWFRSTQRSCLIMNAILLQLLASFRCSSLFLKARGR
jgi:hypothetical protein